MTNKDMTNKENIQAFVEEAAKILKDYPELKYYQAIERAKEVLESDNIQKQC